MGELIVNIIKWTIRIALVITIITAVLVLMTYIITLLNITTSNTVISDIHAIIQIWLPFNLSVVLTWAVTAGTAYITYRLAIYTMTVINLFIGK